MCDSKFERQGIRFMERFRQAVKYCKAYKINQRCKKKTINTERNENRAACFHSRAAVYPQFSLNNHFMILYWFWWLFFNDATLFLNLKSS